MFDRSEFGEEVQEGEGEVDSESIMQQLADDHLQQPEPPPADSMLSEVEVRLEIAEYYRVLLNANLLSEAANAQIAAQVEKEVKGFIRTRLGALFNLGGDKTTAPAAAQAPLPKAKPQFTDREAEVLRILAGGILKNPRLLQSMTGAPTAKVTPAPAHARPVASTVRPAGPRRAAAPAPAAPAPAPKPAPPPAPPKEEEDDGIPKTQTRSAKLRSPHSKQPRTVDELNRSMYDAAAAGVDASNKKLRADVIAKMNEE